MPWVREISKKVDAVECGVGQLQEAVDLGGPRPPPAAAAYLRP
jgi:hypothetical protein